MAQEVTIYHECRAQDSRCANVTSIEKSLKEISIAREVPGDVRCKGKKGWTKNYRLVGVIWLPTCYKEYYGTDDDDAVERDHVTNVCTSLQTML